MGDNSRDHDHEHVEDDDNNDQNNNKKNAWSPKCRKSSLISHKNANKFCRDSGYQFGDLWIFVFVRYFLLVWRLEQDFALVPYARKPIDIFALRFLCCLFPAIVIIQTDACNVSEVPAKKPNKLV